MRIFPVYAELTHLFALTVLLYKLYLTKSAKGVSGKTHILYALVFAARYNNDFYATMRNDLAPWNFIFPALTVYILYLIYFQYKNSNDKEKDSCWIGILVIPCAILASSQRYFNIHSVLWEMSFYLETVTLIPQMVLIHKLEGKMEKHILLYFVLLGSYSGFYSLEWIYEKLVYHNDIHGFTTICSTIETLLFLFFLGYYFLSKRGKTEAKHNYTTNLPKYLAYEKLSEKPLSDLPLVFAIGSKKKYEPREEATTADV